jgi:hypothetical protein
MNSPIGLHATSPSRPAKGVVLLSFATLVTAYTLHSGDASQGNRPLCFG